MPRLGLILLALVSLATATVQARDSRAGETRSVAATPASDTGARIHRVRLGIDDDKTRIVIEITRDTAFRARAGEDGASVTVDFPAARWNAGEATSKGRGLVREVAATGVAGGTHLTLSANGRVAIKAAFKLPGDATTDPRVVIDLARASGDAPAVSSPAARPAPTTSGFLKPPKPADPAPTVSASLRPPTPTPVPEGARASAPPPGVGEKPLIALDPGHGGNDPGAVGASGVFEKDITLATARETKRRLEETGRYRVMLTRDGDYFLELRERVQRARDAGADLFISLHADTIERRPSIAGLSIYTLSETASDREAESLAQKENRADAVAGLNLSTENKDVASILISLAQRDTTNLSNRLAGSLLGRLGRETNLLPIKPHRQAGFAVLTAPDVPSVLIELGYLSNTGDLAHLLAPAHRARLAKGVGDGVDEYFKWLRSSRRT